MYLLWVFIAASAPIIKSAFWTFIALNPFIGFVPLNVSTYIPILDVIASIFSVVLGTTVGFTMFPDGSIIWASVAPAAATIWTPPTLFPVAFPPGTNSFSAPPVTVKLP